MFFLLQMLTMRSNNGLSREHDRQVRLHSVRTDLELDMPPRIHLPDGEEYPYGSMAKLHLRNSEQVRVPIYIYILDNYRQIVLLILCLKKNLHFTVNSIYTYQPLAKNSIRKYRNNDPVTWAPRRVSSTEMFSQTCNYILYCILYAVFYIIS